MEWPPRVAYSKSAEIEDARSMNPSTQRGGRAGIFEKERPVIEGGRPMKIQNPDAKRVEKWNLSPEPERRAASSLSE